MAGEDIPEGDPVISFPVRDLLARIDERTGRIEGKLDNKADRADLAALNRDFHVELDRHHMRLNALEADKQARDASRATHERHEAEDAAVKASRLTRHQQWMVAVAGFAALLIATLGGVGLEALLR